jgi:hypothetical protein
MLDHNLIVIDPFELSNDNTFRSNKFNQNIILRNSVTHLYESFDNDGNIIYKLLLLYRNKNFCYFKIINDIWIIKYEYITQNLYQMTLKDYYDGNLCQNILFDKKIIVVKT